MTLPEGLLVHRCSLRVQKHGRQIVTLCSADTWLQWPHFLRGIIPTLRQRTRTAQQQQLG